MTDKEKEVAKEIRKLILNTFPKLHEVQFTDDDHLVHDDFIDSVDAVELVVVLNKKYGHGFRVRDMTKLHLDSVNGITDIIVNNILHKLK